MTTRPRQPAPGTPAPGKLPLPELAEMKSRRQPIVMVTAYDAPGGRLADAAGADGGCEGRRVEGGDGDVVDLEPRRLEDRARRLGVARREGAREGERATALRGREAGVPGREREPVGVAHGGEGAELDVEVEVAGHRAHDRDLLGVLLPEVGAFRANYVEELAADRRDSAEVAGAVGALEDGPELLDLDPGLVARRVELVGGGGEEHVDSCLLGERSIAGLVSRVAREVLAPRELGRVDEDAHDDRLAFVAGCADEGEVALVEGAHRRHQAELALARKLDRRPNDPHATVALASTS